VSLKTVPAHRKGVLVYFIPGQFFMYMNSVSIRAGLGLGLLLGLGLVLGLVLGSVPSGDLVL